MASIDANQVRHARDEPVRLPVHVIHKHFGSEDRDIKGGAQFLEPILKTFR